MSFLKKLLGDLYKEGMAEDEISQALEKSGIENQSEEISKLRAAVTKSNKENADWKRKYKDLEEAGSDTQNKISNLQGEIEELKKDKKIADNTAEFLALGYSEELAKSTATAMVEGDMTKVFENQKEFQSIYAKNLKAELLKNTPPPARDGVHVPEDFSKMTATEKMKLKVEDPQLYKTLANGGT